MEWSDWIQDVGKTTINTVMEAQYKQPFELQKMQLQAFGPFGAPYIEGSANGQPVAQVAGGIPMSWLLIGGVVALIALAD